MTHDPLRILVVDDDEDDLFLTCSYLSGIDTFNKIVDKEINYNAARKKILQNNHDIYLVDYLLGPETGLDLIRECTKAGVNKPFILLTGRGDKKIDIEATKAGVYDYLTKSGINTEVLERCLRYSLQRYSSYTAVAESEKKYREIFNKSKDIIFVLNSQFQFINFNSTLTTLLGYTLEELDHQPISKLFEKTDEVNKFLYQVEFTDSSNDMEITLLTKWGERKTFLASYSKIVSGEATQYQGILYDYTNIKKSVADQLLNEKIATIAKLVRSLAHEIRNPLTSINLSVHQLEEKVSEDNKVFIDIIRRNSKRINDLIGELMNLSNPPSNEYEKIEIKQIVQSALSGAMDRIKLKQIEVVENFAPQEQYIMCDKSKMQTAFLNLIINAIEAIENDHGKLCLETVIAENIASIKITDNGSGIPAENIPHLFQPYFTGKKNGMGLGLATTHSVIHAHNGNIEVESTPGRGTTFTVNLKLPKAATAAATAI